ncbi:MAG: hypothetical protein ACK5NK_16790 [Niabella sp.]
MPLKNIVLCCLFMSVLHGSVNAQTNEDTEFTKGFEFLLKLNNGLSTGFKAATPDLYVGGLGINPQFTVVANILRVGANAGFVYNDKKLSGLFGPMAALKLKTLGTQYMGSYANIHLLAEANWGTNKQKMAGGGLGVEVFKKLHIAVTAQRDYSLNNWWFQTHIALKLNKAKRNSDD